VQPQGTCFILGVVPNEKQKLQQTMNKKIKILGLVILLIIGGLLYVFYDDKYSEFYPISLILIMVILLIERTLTEIQMKRKKWKRFGKECVDIKHLLLNVIFGLIWILLGHLAIEKHFVWMGLDVRIFIGLAFILSGLIGIRNYVIIIKQDSIFVNGDNKTLDCKIKDIELADLDDKSLIFKSRKKQVQVSMDRLCDSELEDLKLTLKE